jgi:hypothetical protein
VGARGDRFGRLSGVTVGGGKEVRYCLTDDYGGGCEWAWQGADGCGKYLYRWRYGLVALIRSGPRISFGV